VPAGPVEPVGTLADGLVGLGLPFGRIDAPVLARLADAARQAGADSLRPAPGRALIVTGLRRAATAGLIDRAAALGLVTTPDDPRRRIIACVGAPGCASALVSTRDIAALVAERLAEAGDIVHVSGCAKGCAHPRPAALTLVGTPSGVALIRNGRADAVPERLIAPAEVGPLIASRCSKASHDL
jgi:precorrin-3B synthase